MKDSTKIVVVVGANGRLGHLICTKILHLQEDKVIVKALVREGKQGAMEALVKEFSSTKIQVVGLDYSSQTAVGEAFKGAFCVISCLLGLESIIVDLQAKLLKEALKQKVRRFIPSDFAADFTNVPLELNRNFSNRTLFHREADKIMAEMSEVHKIEFTSVYQGGFTELFIEAPHFLDFKNYTFNYFGDPKIKQEYTTWADTALYSKYWRMVGCICW